MWLRNILFFVSIFSFGLGFTLNNVTDNHINSIDTEKTFDSGCQIIGYNYGCCLHMDVPKLHLNDSACVNISYLPHDYGITATVTIDKWVFLNETISARSPPSLCFGEDYLPIGGEICLKFYDLDAQKTKLHGCIQIYAEFEHFKVAKYNIGCFDIGGKKAFGLKLNSFKESNFQLFFKFLHYLHLK